MAKFCGNCGAKLDDDARVCSMCGTPWGGKPIDQYTAPVTRRKNNKIKWLLVLLVCVILVLLIFRMVINSTGTRGLSKKVMDAYVEYDLDTLISLSSDVYYYGSDDWAEIYFETAVGEELDYIEEAVGHSYELSYEINEIYEMSKRSQDKLLESLEESFSDFDAGYIENIEVADVTLTAEQGKRSEEYDIAITMTKEEGKWKLLYIE